MSMGGSGKGGGGGVDNSQGKDAWSMAQQQNTLQNQILSGFLDNWGNQSDGQGQQGQQGMKYSDPFWWDR